MKKCTICRLDKMYSEFGVNRTKADGFQSLCKACAKAYREKSSGTMDAYMARWRAQNPDKLREYSRVNNGKWAAKRRESAALREKWNSYKRQSWAKNKAAERVRNALYKKENPEKARAKNARRRASLLKATPHWADFAKVSEYYFAANFLGMVTGEWYHVDHIVPLCGPKVRSGIYQGERLVCGLHCEFNLQVLAGTENISKSNRRWPDMP